MIRTFYLRQTTHTITLHIFLLRSSFVVFYEGNKYQHGHENDESFLSNIIIDEAKILKTHLGVVNPIRI